MKEFDKNEHVLVVDDYRTALVLAMAVAALVGADALDEITAEVPEADLDEVLEVERGLREQLLMPQRHGGAE